MKSNEKAISLRIGNADLPSRQPAQQAAPDWQGVLRLHRPLTRCMLALVTEGFLAMAGEDWAALVTQADRGEPDAKQRLFSTLYAELHRLDEQGLDWIAVECPPDTPEWAGVRDRLTRAAG